MRWGWGQCHTFRHLLNLGSVVTVAKTSSAVQGLVLVLKLEPGLQTLKPINAQLRTAPRWSTLDIIDPSATTCHAHFLSTSAVAGIT